MSRTNPYKKKKRYAKKTILILGEGMNEEVFLKHLRSLYSFNNDHNIMVKKGRGGDLVSLIVDSSRVPGEFNKRIVFLDDDKPSAETQKAEKIALNKGIKLIKNKPCLEYLLLTILDHKKIPKTSIKCKKLFESIYINRKQRKNKYSYKIFSKKLLDKNRLQIINLNKLISIMEGKN